MRIVGIRRSADALVEVATLSEDGTQVAVLASLIEFWADPAVVLAAPNPGATLPTAQVTLVPPVLPDARVICIGLNYLKHVAEGSYSDQPIPEYPTLFARWTRTLTVDGAQVPVPARRGRPGLGRGDRRLGRHSAGRRHPGRGAGRRRRLLHLQRPDLPPRPEAHLPVDPGQERRPVRPTRTDGPRRRGRRTCGTDYGCRPG